jgi:hypothetical protein
MSELNLLSLLDKPTDLNSPMDEEFSTGFYPDSYYSLDIGDGLSEDTIGLGIEQEATSEDDTLVSARCDKPSECYAAGFCVGNCGVGHHVIIEPIV